MKLYYSDSEIISAIKEGYQDPSNWFYIQTRNSFIKHVSIKMLNIPQLAAEESYYSEELFHESLLRLLNKIYEGKLFVKDDTVFYINKRGEETELSGSLKNLLISIGDNILKEYIRQVDNGTFVPWDEFLRKHEAEDETTDDTVRVIGMQSHRSEDEEDNGYRDTPFIGIPDTEEEEEEDRIHRLVRYIVANMKEPCKSIFKYTYFIDNGRRIRDEEMAPLVNLKNADTVQSRRTQCRGKFRKRFEELIKIF